MNDEGQKKLNTFIEGLTPGNYFLTKSMEISKTNTSGTLWYLKKFLVLYDAIFLSKTIRSADGVNKIKRNFEEYVNSLPVSQRKEANEFFFPENIDIRKEYRTYAQFAGQLDMQYYEDVNQYLSLVDKYYFVYLMNIGGQSGVKAYIRERIYKDNNFEVKKLESIINQYQFEHPGESINVTQIINDYHAPLRNERQILFYFGYVHSRSNGAGNDREFASLTPIGELAIESNAKEFALIWEHQKIKMVSQPLTVEMPSIRNCIFCDATKFRINYSPYLSILKCLNNNGDLTPRFYDYVLSRTNNDNINTILETYDLFADNLQAIKTRITEFGIRSDLAVEDFEKEIKKYLLGIRSDLSKDKGENYYGCVESCQNDAWKITNKQKLNRIVEIYSQIDLYKVKKYATVFQECEKELRIKYYATAFDYSYTMNHRIKMSWDLYNIQKDKIIMLSLMTVDYSLFKDTNIINCDLLTDYVYKNFPTILKSIGITKKQEIYNYLKEIIDRIKTKSLDEIKDGDEFAVDDYYVNKYSTLSSADLWDKIQKVSEENTEEKLERKRDMRIIGLLNAYYLANYSDSNNMIHCECCGNETFLKNNDEPYLEFHHMVPFSIANGPDHYENILALCPTCHRKIHSIKDDYKKDLYEGIDINNHFNKKVFHRLKDLYNTHALKSYHLEYALSEYMISEEEYNLILS